MYGMYAGAEKTAGRGGEDATGRTTKEATGNSIIVIMLMLALFFLNYSVKYKILTLTRMITYYRVFPQNCIKEFLISQERELKRQQAVMLKEQVSS